MSLCDLPGIRINEDKDAPVYVLQEFKDMSEYFFAGLSHRQVFSQDI